MTPSTFEESLRSLLRRQPFQPFAVEMQDGARFVVDRPDAVSMGGGAAGYIAEDGSIHFFDWKQTRRFGQESSGVSA